MKSLVGDRPSWHKEPISFLNKMLSIRKVRLLIMSRYIAIQSYECVIISKMFLIYFISYGCNGGALVFLGGAKASASPSFALPMFITIKKKKILFLGVPAATVGGTGTPMATPLLQGYFFNSPSVDFIYTGSVDLTLGFLLCMKPINLNGLQSALVAGLLFLLITNRVTAIARLARNRYMFCCRPKIGTTIKLLDVKNP